MKVTGPGSVRFFRKRGLKKKNIRLERVSCYPATRMESGGCLRGKPVREKLRKGALWVTIVRSKTKGERWEVPRGVRTGQVRL